MEETVKIRGKIISGAREAAFFTQLDWVKEQCLDKLGFAPYPGTVNIEVSKEDLVTLKLIKEEGGIRLIPPDPQFCEGRTLRASIGGVDGCVFIPPQDVNVHEPNIVEFMAPVMLKSTLGVDDGDLVTVSVGIGG
jgi:CTP-dependent riboflavin kinase